MRKERPLVPDKQSLLAIDWQKVGAMIDPSVHWLGKEPDLQSRNVLFGDM